MELNWSFFLIYTTSLHSRFTYLSTCYIPSTDSAKRDTAINKTEFLLALSFCHDMLASVICESFLFCFIFGFHFCFPCIPYSQGHSFLLIGNYSYVLSIHLPCLILHVTISRNTYSSVCLIFYV